MRLLGIDYGEKRIGLAYADELGLALPLPAAVESSEQERIDCIQKLVTQRQIEAIVIGYPYNMDGSVGFKAREVDAFIERLEKVLPIPIHRVDERLTTHAAQSGLESAGHKGKRDRKFRATGEVDSRAAAIILQDYVDMHLPPVFLDESWPGTEGKG